MTEPSFTPWQDHLHNGAPRELTVHIFGREDCRWPPQRIGALSFPNWIPYGGTLDDQPGPYEMAAAVWNSVVEERPWMKPEFCIVTARRDDPVLTWGTVAAECDDPVCDHCTAVCQSFCDAFAEVAHYAAGPPRLPVGVECWAYRDTEEEKEAMWITRPNGSSPTSCGELDRPSEL